MDDAMLSSYIDNLAEEIEELEAQQADESILNEQYKEDIAQILVDKRAQYDVACDDPRANCPLRTCNRRCIGKEESDDTNWMLHPGDCRGRYLRSIGNRIDDDPSWRRCQTLRN